jgi:hypothetical protein
MPSVRPPESSKIYATLGLSNGLGIIPSSCPARTSCRAMIKASSASLSGDLRYVSAPPHRARWGFKRSLCTERTMSCSQQPCSRFLDRVDTRAGFRCQSTARICDRSSMQFQSRRRVRPTYGRFIAGTASRQPRTTSGARVAAPVAICCVPRASRLSPVRLGHARRTWATPSPSGMMVGTEGSGRRSSACLGRRCPASADHGGRRLRGLPESGTGG